MDNTVSLVRAYLQLNEYFVVTEYPLVELDEQIYVLVERLNSEGHQPDMLIAEVKEGYAN